MPIKVIRLPIVFDLIQFLLDFLLKFYYKKSLVYRDGWGIINTTWVHFFQTIIDAK